MTDMRSVITWQDVYNSDIIFIYRVGKLSIDYKTFYLDTELLHMQQTTDRQVPFFASAYLNIARFTPSRLQ